MITGNCKRIVDAPVEEILKATPEGKLAMFEVISSKDEFQLGLRVYEKRGKLFDFMSNRQQPGLWGNNLMFIAYVDR